VSVKVRLHPHEPYYRPEAECLLSGLALSSSPPPPPPPTAQNIGSCAPHPLHSFLPSTLLSSLSTHPTVLLSRLHNHPLTPVINFSTEPLSFLVSSLPSLHFPFFFFLSFPRHLRFFRSSFVRHITEEKREGVPFSVHTYSPVTELWHLTLRF
jgi:hypothetical protein